jgi:hydrogenase expression/formation protein HypE
MSVKNNNKRDCAPLSDIVNKLISGGIEIHTMRDITRGGLATVLSEIAEGSNVCINLSGDLSFADDEVQGFCDILGLDPLYMGNEGKLVVTVPQKDAARALAIIRASMYGQFAQLIGSVSISDKPSVTIKTRSGAVRTVGPLLGEGLPRIC